MINVTYLTSSIIHFPRKNYNRLSDFIGFKNRKSIIITKFSLAVWIFSQKHAAKIYKFIKFAKLLVYYVFLCYNIKCIYVLCCDNAVKYPQDHYF